MPARDSVTCKEALRFIACVIVFGFVAETNASDVQIEVLDTTSFHIFPPSEPFSFDILATSTSDLSRANLHYQWRDFRGQPMGPPISFSAGARITVSSPSDAPAVGYYGLAFLSDDPGVTFNEASGSRKEIGFVVLPPRATEDRLAPEDSPFGVVHANLSDPNISGWVKTLTWNTIGSERWQSEMVRRRTTGLQELPIIVGDGWTSEDSVVVSERFLATLKDKVRLYFEADAATDHWELGLEENLNQRFSQPVYFANLKAKAAAARDVAEEVNSNVRFVYQIAARNSVDAEKFFASEAASEFDILAPHPYAWPDFPTPDEWLAKFIAELRIAMQRHNVDFPLWFTEIGAPQNDAHVLQMFSGGNAVRAQSRDETAAYVVKAHVIALANGIEKIFWYNYADRDASTTDVEDHFGLVDHWGFPKPSYAAYVAMSRCLEGKSFQEKRELPGNVRVYRFRNSDQQCLVAWTHPALAWTLSLSNLDATLDEKNVTVTNTVGTPLSGSAVYVVDRFPIFITAPADAKFP